MIVVRWEISYDYMSSNDFSYYDLYILIIIYESAWIWEIW